MKRNSFKQVVLIIAVSCLVCHSVALAITEFTREPIMLVDSAQQTLHQNSAQVEFDYNGNIHALWVDNRDGSDGVWGTTITTNGTQTNTYQMYYGTVAHNHSFARIRRSTYDINQMFVMSLNTSMTTYEFCPSRVDLNGLPATPVVTDDSTCFVSTATLFDVISMVSAGTKIVYAMGQGGSILINEYDVSMSTWSTPETVFSPPTDYNYEHPQLAVDADGYIYIVYDRYNSSTGFYDIIARRSQIEYDATSFGPETPVLSTASTFGYHDPEIAVCGSTSGTDLMVAVTYLDPDPSITNIYFDFEFNGVWTDATWIGSTPMVVNGDNSSLINVAGPETIFDGDQDTLYITWADNRSGVMDLYMNTVTGTGFTVGSEKKLTDDTDIQERPFIATGTQPGTVAIAYIKDDAGSDTPYLLLSQPEFFDQCDTYPPANWDSYSGVSLASSPYYSPDYSYQLATTAVRGSLLRDYGSVEQTGTITCQFYDDPTIILADFAVVINNDNQRGVIRMLGVRNDTTQNNYAYSMDGTTWVDSGVARDLGWHEISISVSAGGLNMSIENDAGGGVFTTFSDATFTAFTSIELVGGTDDDPYFVDDILVEANPIVAQPAAIPASSAFSLLCLISFLTYLIRRKTIRL